MRNLKSTAVNILRIIGKIVKAVLITILVLIILAVLTIFSVDRWVAWQGGKAIVKVEETKPPYDAIIACL